MTPRLYRGRLLLLTSLILVSCDSAQDITQPQPGSNYAASPAATLTSGASQRGEIDSYSADIEVRMQMDGGDSPEPLTAKYRVQRTRGDDDVWTSRISFETSSFPGLSRGSKKSQLPVTMVTRDDGSPPRFYDASGREVGLPAPGSGGGPVLAEPLAQASRATRNAFDREAMIDALVLLPSRKAHRAARLAKMFPGNASKGAGKGRSIHRKRIQDVDVEVVVDSTDEFILEETVSRGGRSIGTRKNTLSRLADGTPVVSRVQAMATLEDGRVLRVDQSFTNVSIRKGGPAR
jgi:hypothetical protein